MTDDTYWAPLPGSPHKLRLLYLSLYIFDPRIEITLVDDIEKKKKHHYQRKQREHNL